MFSEKMFQRVRVQCKYQMNVYHYTVSIVHIIHVQVCKQEDTVLNFSSIHSSLGVKLEVNELPKSTGVVVVNSLCIAKG